MFIRMWIVWVRCGLKRDGKIAKYCARLWVKGRQEGEVTGVLHDVQTYKRARTVFLDLARDSSARGCPGYCMGFPRT